MPGRGIYRLINCNNYNITARKFLDILLIISYTIQEMKTELLKEIEQLKETTAELEKRVAALPDENTKWVPKVGEPYCYITDAGDIGHTVSHDWNGDRARIDVKLYPTEQAAIDVREQQDFIYGALSNQAKIGDLCHRFYIDIESKWVESNGGVNVVRKRLVSGLR